uniref:Protein NATD1 n=3 Tax=Sus scrofa TaxID=9823 RepID=A0A8D0TY63_PIG
KAVRRTYFPGSRRVSKERFLQLPGLGCARAHSKRLISGGCEGIGGNCPVGLHTFLRSGRGAGGWRGGGPVSSGPDARGPRAQARGWEPRGAFKSQTECIKTERPRAHWPRAARDRTADFLPPPFCCCRRRRRRRRRVSVSEPPPAVGLPVRVRARLLQSRPPAPLRSPARRAPPARVRAPMAQSPAAVPPGAPEQGCPIRVEHDRRRRQFTVRLNGCHDRAVLLYEYVGKRIVDLQHTEVPDAYRGRGIAKHLAKAALDFVVEEDLKAHLTCWYIQKYVKENPLPQYLERLQP